MRRRVPRPHIEQRIDGLENIAREHWGNPSVLFEVFAELGYRRQRKRKRELRAMLYERLTKLAAAYYFKWPSTAAPGGTGNLDDSDWPQTGLLSYLGYHVGKTGLPTLTRRAILDSVYLNKVPTINNPVYMTDWGEPRTGPRLQKMAESIAAFCRSRKRRDRQFSSAAVADWESDIAYLRARYYDGVYDFPWPKTWVPPVQAA